MRLLALGLALAPLLPPLALLSPLFLPWLARLPLGARALLGGYAASLLLPALFAPEPLAFPLAVGRLLHVLGLVGAGVALSRRKQPLAPLGVGLFLLYLTAFAASYWAYGDQVARVRLMHPFHSPVGLGLMGALGVLLALYLRYPWPFRLLLGLLGGAVLLLSGSRGGMLALLAGGAGGVLFRGRGFLALGLSGLLLLLAAGLDTPVSERFFQGQLSGREVLWLRAYEVYRAHPWTGVGPYLLGDYLRGSLFGACFLFPLLEAKGLTCPPWLLPWGGLWQFAHNHLLQALGESGLPGAIGLLLLVGGFLAAAWGEGLLFSLLLAYTAMGMTDNPFSVPSPFRGEVFFLAGGMALARSLRGGNTERNPFPQALGLGGGVALLWALPFLYLASRSEPPPPTLAYAGLGKEGGVVRLWGGRGYRVQVWLCGGKGCQRLGWEWSGEELIQFSPPRDLPPGRYRLRVLVFSSHRLALKPRYVLEEEVVR